MWLSDNSLFLILHYIKFNVPSMYHVNVSIDSALKFKLGGVLNLAVFWLDMLIFMNITLCNCQK